VNALVVYDQVRSGTLTGSLVTLLDLSRDRTIRRNVWKVTTV